MELQWKDIADYFSEERRHYSGRYLVVDYLLDEKIEVQLYRVIESGFDFKYEIFVNAIEFYGSIYLDKNPEEMVEKIKADFYEEYSKKKKLSKKFIDAMITKYGFEPAMDSFFDFDITKFF